MDCPQAAIRLQSGFPATVEHMSLRRAPPGRRLRSPSLPQNAHLVGPADTDKLRHLVAPSHARRDDGEGMVAVNDVTESFINALDAFQLNVVRSPSACAPSSPLPSRPSECPDQASVKRVPARPE